MIIVLCNSFEEAVLSYEIFLEFLDENEPWHIKKIYDAAYCVETDDDLKYVFLDYRLGGLFSEEDCVDVNSFFDGINSFYYNRNTYLEVL